MASIEDILAQAQPVTRAVRLCLRGDLIAEREALERELLIARQGDLRENRIPEATAVAERIAELEAETDAASVEFKIKAVTRTEWVALLKAHPPTDEEREAGNDFGEGMAAAALAACSVDPEMSLEQAQQLLDTVSTRQFNSLWSAILTANLGDDTLPKSVAATATLHSSGQSSTTAPL